jgi:5-methylcytosine-specific restriction endonuclease McrA
VKTKQTPTDRGGHETPPTTNKDKRDSARQRIMSKQHKHPEYLKNRGVVLREQPICTVCNKAQSTQVDHITPLDAGGGHELENLRGICAPCNNKLGHLYVAQRNNTRQTIRADALRDHGIEIQTTKKTNKFFSEKTQLTMPDGTRWLVQAATPKAFHGFSPTYIVADEVWNISRDVLLNGALPSQRVMQSPLLSCWSTAGTEDSQAMLQMREEGLRAIDQGETTKLYFAEWSVPPGIDPMTSPDLWPMANPALGYTLMPDVLADEAQQVDKAAFLRASLNVWISSEHSWLPPGLFDSLKVDEIPAGGVLAVDSSIDESLYCGVRAQRMPDDLIGVTVEFLADSLAGCWRAIEAASGDCERIALTPSLFDIAPAALDRKKVQVGYAELATHTATIRSLITEGRVVHTGEQMLAEHVDRAVGVKTQRGYALSSQKSSGPITLARCLVFAASLLARPASRAKPAIAFGR